jgi:hypothetical protein
LKGSLEWNGTGGSQKTENLAGLAFFTMVSVQVLVQPRPQTAIEMNP